MNGNGGAPQPTAQPEPPPLFTSQVVPTGTAVLGGEGQMGKVAILHLVWPGSQLQVVLDPASAERVGKELQQMAAQIRSGLQVASPADLKGLTPPDA